MFSYLLIRTTFNSIGPNERHGLLVKTGASIFNVIGFFKPKMTLAIESTNTSTFLSGNLCLIAAKLQSDVLLHIYFFIV